MVELREREGGIVGRDREIALRDERAAETLGLALDDGDHRNLRGADLGIDVEDRLGDGSADAGGGRRCRPRRIGLAAEAEILTVGADEDDLDRLPGGELSDRLADQRQFRGEQPVALLPPAQPQRGDMPGDSSSIRKASVSMISPEFERFIRVARAQGQGQGGLSVPGRPNFSCAVPPWRLIWRPEGL